MNQRPLAPTAALLQQRLQSVLQPSALEVIDESAQHSGHVGANDSGFGSHFRDFQFTRSLIDLPARRRLRGIGLCMMRCKISWIRACMPWPLKPKFHP